MRSGALLLQLFFVAAFVLGASSGAALAHRSASAGPATGLSIPTLTHGQMAVIAKYYPEILALADRQIFTDEPFRRLRNYITLQNTACLWGMVPASLTDENSPFNECSHGYLSGAQALLLHMKSKPRVQSQASALADRIGIEMLDHDATLVVCRYSDEPFNTADVVFPHWGDVPLHPPSLLTLCGVLGTIASALVLGFLALRGPARASDALPKKIIAGG